MNNKTIKILEAAVIVSLLCATGTVFSSSPIREEATAIEPNTPSEPLADYTHTVLVEGVTASWCQPCHYAANAIYSIYNSGLYDFYYVALVEDRLSLALQRASELGWSGYIPEYFFDGGYQQVDGWGGSSAPYINGLNVCGARANVADIDIELYVDWEGGGDIRLFVDVTNNGATTYNGHLHAYITEIESRWNTWGGVPYHFAMIGYGMNQDITVPPGGTYHRSTLWKGSLYGFGDIELGNIMVIASAFDGTTEYTDETTAAEAKRVGDINGDGVVNVLDFLLLLGMWGQAGGPADINHDGMVNVQDFLLLLANWG